MRSSREPGGAQGRPLPYRPGDTEDADLGWLQALGQAVWPDWDSPPGLHPDHPSAPFQRIDYAPKDPPSGGQQWAAQLASGARPQAVLTGPQLTGPQLTGPQLTGPRRVDDYDYLSTRWEPTEEPGIPLWLAKRVLAEAGDEAAAIRAAAQREAAEIRQQAAEIRQQAADEAAGILAAAERDAAQMRTSVLTMSTELSEIAAYVTQNLATPAMPVIPAMPAVRPAARPARQPEAEPARQRKADPAKKVTGRSRQHTAMRIVASAVAVLMVFGVTAGATEVGLHGFRFFVFRSAGTGATPGSGLNENQGPGQPDAPKAHVHAPKAHAPTPTPTPRPHGRHHKPSPSAGASHG